MGVNVDNYTDEDIDYWWFLPKKEQEGGAQRDMMAEWYKEKGEEYREEWERRNSFSVSFFTASMTAIGGRERWWGWYEKGWGGRSGKKGGISGRKKSARPEEEEGQQEEEEERESLMWADETGKWGFIFKDC